ncbi:hypothetical protein EG329_006552 [Mollisiaceae sp. DMI_Dod_QoI]|nr:hypothetical protein EG329_006552 [Helotiales sp. DMI_Dod_QoI]
MSTVTDKADHNSKTDMMRISSTVLDTLVASIKKLEDGISKLQADTIELRATNVSLSKQVEYLRCNVRVSNFSKFKDLPTEIRLMVWRTALSVPQIHIMTDRLISRSKVNLLMQVCREARDEGLKLKLPFYHVGPPSFVHRGIRNYMNYDKDIIWVAHGNTVRPEFIMFYCSQCLPWPWPDSFAWQPRWPKQVPRYCDLRGHNTHRVGGIAINYDEWKDPPLDEDGEWHFRTINPWWCYGRVRSLFIVVNHEEAIQDRDIVFVKPALSPYETLPGISPQHPERTWDALAEDKVNKMKRFERIERRKLEIEDGFCKEWMDKTFPEWIAPSIRFVEARPASAQKDWIILGS